MSFHATYPSPTDIAITPGDSCAVVSFTPVDEAALYTLLTITFGFSPAVAATYLPITYEVGTLGEGIMFGTPLASGTSSPITVSGLTNGTTYTLCMRVLYGTSGQATDQAPVGGLPVTPWVFVHEGAYPVYPLPSSQCPYSRKRTPVWKSILQESVSGKQVAAALWTTPRWKWELQYDVIGTNTVNGRNYTGYDALAGLFHQCRGQYLPFRFLDPEDCSITGQHIGTGDGSTVSFQMVRSLGGVAEPVKDVMVSPQPVVYVAGAVVTGWTISADGVLTFTTAPAAGAAVTADFSFYWRCRFLSDELELENFADLYWSAGKVEFESVK